QGKRSSFSLSLDITATAFQKQVRNMICEIPYGQTRTYSDIARAVGAPRSVRAVANVCAGNPLALIIPCHRVVSKNGSLAGYQWGLARKAALLKHEQIVSRSQTEKMSLSHVFRPA